MKILIIILTSFIVSASTFANDLTCKVRISNSDGAQITFSEDLDTDGSKSFFYSKRTPDLMIITSGFFTKSKMLLKIQTGDNVNQREVLMPFTSLKIEDLSNYTRRLGDIDLEIICE